MHIDAKTERKGLQIDDARLQLCTKWTCICILISTLKNDCFISCPNFSDILPILSDILFMPSAKLSGIDFTALETFLIELRKGFTKVSIYERKEGNDQFQHHKKHNVIV